MAITGLSLDKLSQVHWIVKGFFALSLLSSLMAVYYATTQQRAFGQLIKATQVRRWIRGRDSKALGRAPTYKGEFLFRFCKRIGVSESTRLFRLSQLSTLSNLPNGGHGDPADFKPTSSDLESMENEIIIQCFTPSVASVITISAPQVLLATSLLSLLVGLGMYFAYLWTRNLDAGAGEHHSRNVMAFYLAALVACVGVYSISRFIQDEEETLEGIWLLEFFEGFKGRNPNIVRQWGLTTESHIAGNNMTTNEDAVVIDANKSPPDAIVSVDQAV